MSEFLKSVLFVLLYPIHCAMWPILFVIGIVEGILAECNEHWTPFFAVDFVANASCYSDRLEKRKRKSPSPERDGKQDE